MITVSKISKTSWIETGTKSKRNLQKFGTDKNVVQT
jgi:hypothetical protein